MQDCVVIKSYQNGINLLLNEEVPFSVLLDEIEYKFYESNKFFGTAKMALSFEGRNLSDAQEIAVLNTIRRVSSVNIVCIVGRDEKTNQHFLKALSEMDHHLSDKQNDGQFYKGTLKNNQVLESESSIIILGDVYPGSAVIAAKDIIVLGGLFGEAYAGGNGEDTHYVVALEMEPERLKIGDFKYRTNDKSNKWSLKPKVQPKIAYVKAGRLVVEPLTKELLSMF